MTQEDKELLLKDLCSRLPYGVKVEITNWVGLQGSSINMTLDNEQLCEFIIDDDTDIKPYLRPMSSMTEEEEKEYRNIGAYCKYPTLKDLSNILDWLNKNKFDYRGLIPMGLALEAKEGMYNLK